ncbi:MAG: hypothetical protein EWV81_20210 [Microcystis aeruginosa Ma_SC_T_19800800_S464]|uniref:Uncharacterized protein n=1 Tax=Microcystis aeruginosa Ma_SC_T_19800800_S464 TaxID=2486257 RepID=A0A552DGT0_MICAE|nr:MAG: hypothetical protein EWV81_20210 [Microcystis aeruginosa Ma_SC_T_19800800_S464]
MNLKTLLANIFRLFCHQKSARYWSNRGEVFGTFSLKMPKIPHTPHEKPFQQTLGNAKRL